MRTIDTSPARPESDAAYFSPSHMSPATLLREDAAGFLPASTMSVVIMEKT